MMPSAIKHFRYWKLRSKVQMMHFMEYRADLLMGILGTYGYSFAKLTFLGVLFTQVNSLAGWNFYEMLLLYAIAELIVYLHYSFFGPIVVLSEAVLSGELDRYLLKPLSAFFTLSFDDFRLLETLPSFLIPVGIIWISNPHLNLLWWPNGPIALLVFVISLIIYFLFKAILGLLSFWILDVNPLINFYENLSDFEKYPLDIFPKFLRSIFLTIIPIGLVAYVPTVFFIRGFQLDLFLCQLFGLGIFTTLTKILWTKGLQNYSSASS